MFLVTCHYIIIDLSSIASHGIINDRPHSIFALKIASCAHFYCFYSITNDLKGSINCIFYPTTQNTITDNILHRSYVLHTRVKFWQTSFVSHWPGLSLCHKPMIYVLHDGMTLHALVLWQITGVKWVGYLNTSAENSIAVRGCVVTGNNRRSWTGGESKEASPFCVSVETNRPMNEAGLDFINELDRRMLELSDASLCSSVSVIDDPALQRGSFCGCFVDSSDRH